MDVFTYYPSAPSDLIYQLHDDLLVYFNFSLLYSPKFHFIKVINVSDKPITLPSDTLIATAHFPWQHLYLHKVSNDMLKQTKTFQQDCLHANLHQTVAEYFTAKFYTDNQSPASEKSVILGDSQRLPDVGKGYL